MVLEGAFGKQSDEGFLFKAGNLLFKNLVIGILAYEAAWIYVMVSSTIFFSQLNPNAPVMVLPIAFAYAIVIPFEVLRRHNRIGREISHSRDLYVARIEYEFEHDNIEEATKRGEMKS
jgi:hypothetical protein